MKKSIHAIAFVTAVLGALSLSSSVYAAKEVACAKPDEDVNLRIWFGRDAFIPDAGIAPFEKKHPHISVHIDTLPLE